MKKNTDIENKASEKEAASSTNISALSRYKGDVLEELLKPMAEFSSDGFWYWDRSSGTEWWSPLYRQLIGYSEAELPASRDSWVSLLHPDEREHVIREFDEYFSSRSLYEIEYRIRTKDKGYRWFRGYGNFQNISGDRSDRIVGFMKDISAQKKIEQDSRLSAQIMENILEGIILTRLNDGVIVYTNPKFEKSFGYEPGGLLGKLVSVLNAKSESDPQEIANEIIEAVKANGSWSGQVHNIKKDGTEFWSWAHASIFEHNEYGKVLLAVQQDISDQIITNQALKETEIYLEEARKIVHLGYWRHILATGDFIASDELYRISGLPLGVNFDAFVETIHPDDREGLATVIKRCTKYGEPYDFKNRLTCLDGKKKWVRSIGKAITNETGKVIEIVGVTQEITESQMAEEELQKMQKLKSLGVLAGGIAHDFNNILTILFGNISLTKSQLPKDHAGFKTLENAEEAFQRASRLTNQLLTFSKGGDPIKRRINLNKLIEEVTRFDLTGSNVKLCFKSDKNLWSINADEGQMEQVFTNLVINANQAMRAGGHLYITVENIDTLKAVESGFSPGKYIKVTVRDEGTGIAPEQLDQVFDPYFSTKHAGNGLGLAVVFSIINRHDGHINVDSELGKGTTFTLYFPASELQQLAEVDLLLAEVSGKEHAGRILVMDDEEMICDLAKAVLESKGYSVEAATDGKQAISMYRQSIDDGQPYDCLIMDITIPGGMGGKEAIGEILKINPAAKAIVSSGYGVVPVMADYNYYGFKGVLPKPFTPNSMCEVVDNVLSEELC